MLPFLAIVGIGLLIIAGLVFAWWLEQKRTQALAKLAEILQWRFDPERNTGDAAFQQFAIFRRGYDRCAFNTMTGELQMEDWRLQCRGGDFRYKTDEGTGKDRRTETHRFSYLVVHLPSDTPQVLVRPEGILDKVAAAFGFDDIDFESAEFSKRFFVKSSDKRFAYDLMHPRMMQFLLAERPPMLDIENGAVCISDGSRRWSPEDFHGRVSFLRRFMALWPRHLVKAMEGS